MNKRNFIALIVILILISSCIFYIYNFSSKAILNKVVNQEGYIVNEIENSVSVKYFIKPEWIAFKENERKEINIKLGNLYGADLYLKDIWNRENEIYFNINTQLNMNYSEGKFISIGKINDDGSYTSYSLKDSFKLYNKDNRNLNTRCTGAGPGSDFSFSVDVKNQDMIINGFYFEFSGFSLYEYSKK